MKIIIAGAGNVGTHLAKLLSREKQDIILMDDDEEKLSALSANFDLLTVAASPSSISGLKEVGVKEAGGRTAREFPPSSPYALLSLPLRCLPPLPYYIAPLPVLSTSISRRMRVSRPRRRNRLLRYGAARMLRT